MGKVAKGSFFEMVEKFHNWIVVVIEYCNFILKELNFTLIKYNFFLGKEIILQ